MLGTGELADIDEYVWVLDVTLKGSKWIHAIHTHHIHKPTPKDMGKMDW